MYDYLHFQKPTGSWGTLNKSLKGYVLYPTLSPIVTEYSLLGQELDYAPQKSIIAIASFQVSTPASLHIRLYG